MKILQPYFALSLIIGVAISARANPSPKNWDDAQKICNTYIVGISIKGISSDGSEQTIFKGDERIQKQCYRVIDHFFLLFKQKAEQDQVRKQEQEKVKDEYNLTKLNSLIGEDQ